MTVRNRKRAGRGGWIHDSRKESCPQTSRKVDSIRRQRPPIVLSGSLRDTGTLVGGGVVYMK